jgi:hypothetical protein
MDMTPPQAPPAVVSSTQQEAIDGLQRLIDVQTWLAEQQAALPALPAAPHAEDRTAYLARLDAWWRQPVDGAPGAPSVARSDALATRLAATMRDEAIVRRIDGTLDEAAASLATAFARSSGGVLPPGIHARRLRVGEVDYAGAVIVASDTPGSPTLLFMPDHGWEAFETLDALHARTEVRLRQIMAHRQTLPGVRDDEAQQVATTSRFVDSAPLNGDVFQALARRMGELHRQKLADAWPEAGATDASRLADDIAAADDLHDLIDVFALVSAREMRLAVAASEARLARVPAEVAQGWRRAVAEYRMAGMLAVGAAQRHASAVPLDLAQWSRRELAAALSRHRVAVDPDDIAIEATGTEAWSLPGSSSATGPTRMSLAEFALRNTGVFDARSLRVVSAHGTPPPLQTLRDIVRELNLAPRFATYLREKLRDPDGRPYRTASMRLQQARMRLEAADARMATYLADEPAVFLDDNDDRGYRLVEAVLDSPAAATRRTVGGHRVSVRQLVYQGEVVSDVLVIGVRDPRSSSRVVLYTPGAPDGRSFHEFADRATAARQFLYAPAFEEYLLRRLPAELGEPRPNGSGRRFRVSASTARAHWVLSAPRDGRGTLTEGPFEERLVDGDIRTALFDAEVVRQARDLAWAGRSTAQADAEAITGLLGVALAGSRGPAAPILETFGAVGQALQATWRFYDNVKAGNGSQAFVDFTEAYTASLSLVGWHGALSAGRRSVLSLAQGRGGKRAPSSVRLPDSHPRLDTRYATDGIDLSGTRPDASGIHWLDGRRYIRQQGRVFEIRHDAALDAWRLKRPNALDSAFPGPAIEPGPSGPWRIRTDIGLRGGWVEPGAMPQPNTRGIMGQELQGLTEFQRWTFQQAFRRRLHNVGEANLLYWEATSQPTPRFVTLRQRTAWSDALREARGTPAEPLAPGAAPPPGATWRVLPPEEWPTSVWHAYHPGNSLLGLGRDGSLVVPLQAVPRSGLRGLPARSAAPVPADGSDWLQIHLDRYRARIGTADRPGIRVIEDRHGGVTTYVIQPDAGFPLSFVGLEAGDFTPLTLP